MRKNLTRAWHKHNFMNPNQNSLTQDPTRVRSHTTKPDPRAEKRTDPSLSLNLFFKDGYTPQEAMLKNFLDFSLPISDICQYHHFSPQLNLQFLELNVTLLKLEIYLQTIIIGEKTQFELNRTSFKWASPWSARLGLNPHCCCSQIGQLSINLEIYCAKNMFQHFFIYRL